MGNGKSLPQHAKPEPALSLKLAEITEKNLRRPSRYVPSLILRSETRHGFTRE
jgi:hypothetical protein